MPLPDAVKPGLLIEHRCKARKSYNVHGVGRHFRFDYFWHEVGWALEIQAQRNVLGEIASGIGPDVLTIELAHRIRSLQPLVGSSASKVDFRPNLLSQGIGTGEFVVVAASIDRREDRENCFAGF